MRSREFARQKQKGGTVSRATDVSDCDVKVERVLFAPARRGLDVVMVEGLVHGHELLELRVRSLKWAVGGCVAQANCICDVLLLHGDRAVIAQLESSGGEDGILRLFRKHRNAVRATSSMAQREDGRHILWGAGRRRGCTCRCIGTNSAVVSA